MKFNTHWKQYFINVVYFHYRLVAIVIITLGGCVALWTVYHFLLTSAPVEQIQEQVIDVPIDTKALERVTLWNTTIQEEGKTPITIPNGAFAIPTPAP